MRVDKDWHTAVSSQHVVARSKSQLERIAASIIALDGTNVRDAARMDADDELVRLVREADASLTSKRNASEQRASTIHLESDFGEFDGEMPNVIDWRAAP